MNYFWVFLIGFCCGAIFLIIWDDILTTIADYDNEKRRKKWQKQMSKLG